jgi:beta-glucosidase
VNGYRSVLSFLVVGLVSVRPSASETPAPPAPPAAAELERRVESILGQMTLEEKIDSIGGVDGFFVRDVARLGVPRLKMADGPLGVRNFGPATAMAAGIGLAATWNPDLAERMGRELGRDSRAKGVHFLLAPGVNIYRAPMNGRNFEYFGEDPLLAGRIAVGYIKGVQSQGVSATIKHFVGNNSEFDRHHTDSVIDERALREIYLPAFEAGVKSGQVGAVMTAYNLTNGVHMSQHGPLNIDVLRKDWGFEGVLMSDWTSTYDGIACANGGLDLEMPSGKLMSRETLLPAVREGKVSTAAIDEKVRRMLRLAARYGWLDRAQADPDIPRLNLAGRQVALESAREAMVLLKNDGGLLPLDRAKVRTVAVIGPNAYPAVPAGGGSGRVEPFVAVSFLEGLAGALGTKAVVHYHRGLPTLAELMEETEVRTKDVGGEAGFVVELFDKPDFTGTPTTTRTIKRERNVDAYQSPASAASRWTGYFTPKQAGEHELFIVGPGETSGYRISLDGAVVLDAWETQPALFATRRVSLTAASHKLVIEQQIRRHQGGFRFRIGLVRPNELVAAEAKAMAARADVVVVAAGYNHETESEAADRTFTLPLGQDALIREIAAANKNTIVVVTSGGGVDASTWIDAVPALIQAWFPGEEGGTALAEILLGDVNPSGRLPATFERRFEDNPVHESYYTEPGTKRIVYKEGVFVGYRGYEKNGTKPLFAFGHGLSYTTFRFGTLTVTPAGSADGKVEVSFDVTNTGRRGGAEVAQVYVGEKAPKLPRPLKELKGFAKVRLEPGETKRVTVALDPRSFSYYDVRARQWRADAGEFEIQVGRASDAIEQTGVVRLTKALLTPR